MLKVLLFSPASNSPNKLAAVVFQRHVDGNPGLVVKNANEIGRISRSILMIVSGGSECPPDAANRRRSWRPYRLSGAQRRRLPRQTSSSRRVGTASSPRLYNSGSSSGRGCRGARPAGLVATRDRLQGCTPASPRTAIRIRSPPMVCCEATASSTVAVRRMCRRGGRRDESAVCASEPTRVAPR